MDIEKYFAKNKTDGIEKIKKIISELDGKVEKYVDGTKPILNGKIEEYSKIIANKHLSQNATEISSVLNEFSQLFQRSVMWENAGTMINITPPANIASLAASFYTSLFNPNFAQDESSGYLMTTELIVSKYLSELVDWDTKRSGGIFTFGGKGTNMYAAKIGIKKSIPNADENGLNNTKIAVFSSEKGHPCHKEICDWLGLGKNSCIRIPVNRKGQLILEEFEKQLRNHIENGEKIACIILNGGTTNEIIVDPIKKVVELRDKIVEEYKLDYKPHVHVDAVIGWAWLFFKFYNFESNILSMNKTEIKKIKSLTKKMNEIKYADSFGADFHKTGFCPYISSIFMAKEMNDITSLGNKTPKNIDEMQFGEYSPFEYTLELTRSSIGPVSAYIALETFGVEGFQSLIYKVFSNSEYIRKKLNRTPNFEVINLNTEGIATLFIVKPNGELRRYENYVTEGEHALKDLINYNYQFYLYCLKRLEENEVNFKITFSKSFKPFGSKIATGALKIYPTSPIVSKKEISLCLEKIIETKKIYDKLQIELRDNRKLPVDYVYRD